MDTSEKQNLEREKAIILKQKEEDSKYNNYFTELTVNKYKSYKGTNSLELHCIHGHGKKETGAKI